MVPTVFIFQLVYSWLTCTCPTLQQTSLNIAFFGIKFFLACFINSPTTQFWPHIQCLFRFVEDRSLFVFFFFWNTLPPALGTERRRWGCHTSSACASFSVSRVQITGHSNHSFNYWTLIITSSSNHRFITLTCFTPFKYAPRTAVSVRYWLRNSLR